MPRHVTPASLPSWRARSWPNRTPRLDIETPDVDGEVGRLESIGARRLEPEARAEHGSRWVIMADLEGNEFCVCDGGAEATS